MWILLLLVDEDVVEQEQERQFNRLLEILSAIQYDDNGKNSQFGIGTIDFNKIVPIPEPLIVDDEVCPFHALCLYLTSINPDVDYFDGTKLSQEEFQAMLMLSCSRRKLL